MSDGVGGETWTKTSLSGSAAVRYNAGDTVYFCVTKHKAKLAQKNITISVYSDDFVACVINTAITKASHYSEVLDILKANAGLLGISASSLTSDATKYVQLNITDPMLTIAELKGLAEKGIASSAVNTSLGGGTVAAGTLTAKDIITGKDNNMFAPLDSTSRAEAAVIIYRVLNTK
ncbi:MAG: S-layer homology domain-containing protein [Candidatus Ornithomonoglobus sp.]